MFIIYTENEWILDLGVVAQWLRALISKPET